MAANSNIPQPRAIRLIISPVEQVCAGTILALFAIQQASSSHAYRPIATLSHAGRILALFGFRHKDYTISRTDWRRVRLNEARDLADSAIQEKREAAQNNGEKKSGGCYETARFHKVGWRRNPRSVWCSSFD